MITLITGHVFLPFCVFDWMLEIMSFTLLGVGHFLYPYKFSLAFFPGRKFTYLETAWSFQVLLYVCEAFSVAELSLGLTIPYHGGTTCLNTWPSAPWIMSLSNLAGGNKHCSWNLLLFLIFRCGAFLGLPACPYQYSAKYVRGSVSCSYLLSSALA